MREAKEKIVGILVFVGLIIYCSFSGGGFVAGMRTLGEIVNIFGLVFVKIIDAVFSISEVAQEIAKRVITTLLVWGFYGVGLRATVKKNSFGALWAALRPQFVPCCLGFGCFNEV